MGYKYNPFTGDLDIVSSAGGSGAGVDSIDSDSGTANPVAGVINILGAGSISTSATGNTLTITDGVSALDFTSDSGTASVSGNNINVLGGTNINTSGASDNITINLDAVITIDEADIGNIKINNNDILSTDTNGNINLVPDGTGKVRVTYATLHAIPKFGNLGAINEIGPLNDGEIIIGATGASADAGSLTSTGGTITITPGANTINLEAVAGGGGAEDFVTDSGTATESGGTLNALGGNQINTSGSGDTLTINLDTSVTVTNLHTDDTASGLTLTSESIRADGTDTNIDINIAPKGAGGAVITTNLTVGGIDRNSSFVVNGSSLDTIITTQAEGATDVIDIANARYSDSATRGTHLALFRSRGTEGSPTIVQDGDILSKIYSAGYDGTDYALASEIRTSIDGTPGAGDMPTKMEFYTTADGNQSPTRAMSIFADQSILMDGTLTLGLQTENAVPYFSTSGLISEIGPLTNGQLLIGSTGASPVAASLTSSGGSITITPGAGSINLEAATDVGAVDFVTDSGTATESGGSLNVLGGNQINTSGTGDTLTVNLDTDVTVTNLFTDDTASGLTITADSISADGTDTDIDIMITPKGDGGAVISSNLTVGGADRNSSFVVNGSTLDALVTSQAESVSDTAGIVDVRYSDTGAIGGHFLMLRTRGSESTPAVVQNNDIISKILTAGYDGTDYALGSEIRTSVSGTPGDGDMPTKMEFFTSNNGSQTPTLALTINPDQSIEIEDTLTIASQTNRAIPYFTTGGLITELGPLSDGQMILGSSGADPVAASITSSGSTIDITAGAGTLNLETADSVATSYSGDSGSAVPSSGVLTVAGTGGIVTSGSGSTLTVDGSGISGGITWSVETGTTATIAASEGIFANNAGGVTVTLPATAAVGDTFQVVAMDAAGFTIDYGTGQSVQISGTTSTTTSGTLVSTGEGDWIELVCNVANTGFFANVKQGNITVT